MNFEYVISGMTMGTGDLYYNKSALSPYASVFNDKITFYLRGALLTTILEPPGAPLTIIFPEKKLKTRIKPKNPK